MATPVGHYLVGLSVAKVFARDDDASSKGFWLATLACAPDLDVIPGMFVGDLARFHHGFSHSLVAAALVSGAIVGALRCLGRETSWHLFLTCFLIYTSHLLLDWVTLDPGKPSGVPLFWPLNESYQAPWALLPNVQHTRGPILSTHNFLLMIRELIMFVPLAALIHSVKATTRPWSHTPTWLYGCWFFLAVCFSAFFLAQNN